MKRAPKALVSSLKELIEPSLRPTNHGTQTGWEHFAYQGFIFGNFHSLVEMADVLHRVRSTIIHGERWLSETPRKLSSFNPTRKR